MVPRDTAAPANLPVLGVEPLVMRIGKGVLAVYVFTDTTARARAGRGLDTMKFVRPDAALTVASEGTRIESDNLLALLFGKNEHQRERVSDVFMAGAPQP